MKTPEHPLAVEKVLRCSECHKAALPDAIFCGDCGGLLAFEITPSFSAATYLEVLKHRRLSNDLIDMSGIWRYRELLPSMGSDDIITLRENAVPIYPAVQGAKYADIARLSYLHLGMNPTASFKDAGMTVAISQAKAQAAKVVICASTGNTAASMAAYAARAGLRAVVLVPNQGISAAKIAQTLDYGAEVIAIDGDFDAALDVVRTVDPQRVVIVNSINPYRIEGQKCAPLQMLEQRGWTVPDWIVLPGGNLGNTSAFGKGLREAQSLGLIDRLPRLAVIQAVGAAPFVPVITQGTELVPVTAKTTATAIKIGAPASWKKARAEVRFSHGTAHFVSDEAIADARAIIGRDGIGCEPASAASLAGARELRQRGMLGALDDVVLVLTGHLLKDTGYAAHYHESAQQFSNVPRAFSSAEDVVQEIDRLIEMS